jgi:hypothetical protein
MSDSDSDTDDGPGQRTCIVPHLGLGDMIVLNGMVRAACRASDEVLLFAKRAYVSSVRSLFGDLRNLRLKFVEEAHEFYADDCALLRSAEAMGYRVVTLGDHTGSREWMATDPAWTHALYRHAGLDPRLMYDRFHVVRNEDREQAMLRTVRAAVGDVYVVVHDDPARDLVINRDLLPTGMAVVHVDDPRWRTNNIVDYAAVIDNAMHLHALDSCFMLMADFMDLRPRKFCHAYCREFSGTSYKSNVTVIRLRH